MKKLLAATAIGAICVSTTMAQAGNLKDAEVEAPVIVPEPAGSSAGPLLPIALGALVLCAVACGGSDDGTTVVTTTN
jgi:hypothetical protein